MQRVLSAKLTRIVKGLVSDVDTYDESRTYDILRYFNTLIFVSNFTQPHRLHPTRLHWSDRLKAVIVREQFVK